MLKSKLILRLSGAILGENCQKRGALLGDIQKKQGAILGEIFVRTGAFLMHTRVTLIYRSAPRALHM